MPKTRLKAFYATCVLEKPGRKGGWAGWPNATKLCRKLGGFEVVLDPGCRTKTNCVYLHWAKAASVGFFF